MELSEEFELKLVEEIDKVSSQFVSSFGLVHTKEIPNIEDSLIRWIDFRYRYIDISKRNILYSNEFPKKLCVDARKGLKTLEAKITRGQDINPHLSKTVWKNDTSSRKAHCRTDPMWADFGITHLHLTDKPVVNGEYFVPRSKWLLFCLVFSDTICFIDIKDHNEPDVFTDPDYLQTIADSFPSYFDQFALKGVNGVNIDEKFDANAVKTLRKAAVNSCFMINGKVYLSPGGGFVSAGLSFNVMWQAGKIRRAVLSAADTLFDPSIEIGNHLKKAGIYQPDVELVLYDGKLGMFEKK